MRPGELSGIRWLREARVFLSGIVFLRLSFFCPVFLAFRFRSDTLIQRTSENTHGLCIPTLAFERQSEHLQSTSQWLFILLPSFYNKRDNPSFLPPHLPSPTTTILTKCPSFPTQRTPQSTVASLLTTPSTMLWEAQLV